ncbi:MAG: imidazolonepropionase [Saprospiraceae bacterium]|nr:imidazolonepropionase [Saprospiraceae bacterium]
MLTLIKNIKKAYGAHEAPLAFLKGKKMAELPVLEDAYIYIQSGRIAEVGLMKDLRMLPDISHIIDASRRIVIPGYVDCHTHPVFGTWRNEEFVDKIKGLSYQEIAARGGGILQSAARLGAMSEDQLYELAKSRLQQCIRNGTVGIEIKSGYGLSLESELKIMRVIKRLKLDSSIPIRSTFLGAHAYPEAYKQDHRTYLALLTERIMPIIQEEELADYCDVFCEDKFFSVEETDLILEQATKYGMKPRIHTNQFTHSGGIGLAIRRNALSVDHLEVLNDEELNMLSESNTIPVVLPIAAHFMNLEMPPARNMIDKGLGVAIATDFNPGTAPSCDMNQAFSLSCIKMRLLPEEALSGLTINAAYALEWSDQLGSITPGKHASFLISKPDVDLSYIPYSMSPDWIDQIYLSEKGISGS